MYRYKHSLTKIDTFYSVVFLNGTNCRFVDYTNTENLDTILLFLSSFVQFFVKRFKIFM